MEQENKPKPKSIETYTDDMVKVLEGDTGGTIKKIIHEEEEKEKQKKNVSPQSLKNRIFLVVGIILLVVSFGAIASSSILVKKISTVPVAPQPVPVIYTDGSSSNEISGLSDKEVSSLVANKVASTDVKQGGIEEIFLTKNGQNIGFPDLISSIKSNFPTEGIPFVNDFILGAYNGTSGKDLFILLKVRSFDDIFGPMRTWETKMFSDLQGLFRIDLSSDTSYLTTKNFEDGIINNKNARILYDNNGNIVLMYIYVDDTSVLITDSIPTATEVMARLASAKVGK